MDKKAVDENCNTAYDCCAGNKQYAFGRFIHVFISVMVNLILVCGNPLMDEDNIVLSFLSRLREDFAEIEFREFDPTEELGEDVIGEGIVYIIDAVEGLDKVRVIRDLDALSDSPKYSAHDYDLAFDLKMLVKMNRIKGAVIFGVPASGDDEELYSQLKSVLKSTLV